MSRTTDQSLSHSVKQIKIPSKIAITLVLSTSKLKFTVNCNILNNQSISQTGLPKELFSRYSCNHCWQYFMFAFNSSNLSKFSSESLLRLGVSICPPTLNSLFTAADDSNVVLYCMNTDFTDGYLCSIVNDRSVSARYNETSVVLAIS